MSTDGGRHAAQTRIVLRPVGSALPLGFFAFGIGMLLLACQAIGWIPVHEQKSVGMILMSFVFPLELIATIFGLLALGHPRRDDARPVHDVVAHARLAAHGVAAGVDEHRPRCCRSSAAAVRRRHSKASRRNSSASSRKPVSDSSCEVRKRHRDRRFPNRWPG